MNELNRKIIFDGLNYLAIAFDHEVSEQRLAIYVEHLIAYDMEKIKAALALCLKFEYRFPSLAEILNYIEPRMDKKNEANDLAGAIISCMHDFGRYREGEVYEHVGPKGQLAIERFGGWESICNTLESDMGNLRAQLRDICASVSEIEHMHRVKLPYQKEATKRLSDCLERPQIINLQEAKDA